MSLNRVTDENYLPGIIDALQDLNRYEVEAGIFGANATKYVPVDKRSGGQTSTINMLELAQILHWGCHITITPKMRAWLNYQGVHLKASTKQIVIPARPWIDAANDKAVPVVMKVIERAIDSAIDHQKSGGRVAWNRAGALIVGLIKKEMVDLKKPKNSSLTIHGAPHPEGITKGSPAIRGKESENPLVDHGHLVGSNTYEVRQG